MTTAKRKGPAPKGGDVAATRIMTMRLRPADYEALRGEAEANGRSISAQAESRLFRPQVEVHELGRMVGLAIAGVEARAGKSWRDDPDVQLRVRAAAEGVLDLLLGKPIDQERLRTALLDELNRADRIAAGQPRIFDLLLRPEPLPIDELRRRAEFVRDLDEDAVAVANQEFPADLAK